MSSSNAPLRTQTQDTVKLSSSGDLQGQPQAKEPGVRLMTCALEASKGEVEASEAWELMKKEGFGVKTAV